MSLLDKKTDDVDKEQSLISIVIFNYDSGKLEECLDTIFGQNQITGFEVILCDDATTDGSWEIANKYMLRYPNMITLTRNQTTFGEMQNANKGLHMIKGGKYYVELTRDRKFDPDYILQIISKMESDPLIVHSYIGKTQDFRPMGIACKKPSPEMKRTENPLVSICVYNYNYGRFLQQCLDSIADQTYDNIEICFSDNASTDDSWQIALDFSKRYPKKISMTRNRMNFGASSNLKNCFLNNQGKYMLMLCTDDAMKPDFVEHCVTLLEQYQNAAFAMVHRDIIDDENRLISELPFYDQTCLIQGDEQAAVYMMASVNPSVSQILYNWERIDGMAMLGGLNDRWFGARILDFNICIKYPIIYINKPLLLNRVHPLSDGASIDSNLIQCIGQYVLLHQFAEIASASGLNKVANRLNDGVDKVGKLCLRYCARFLLKNDENTALRYLHLAQAIFPAIVNEATFQNLQQYWYPCSQQGKSKKEILALLENQANLAIRNVSYSPPPGSIPC